MNYDLIYDTATMSTALFNACVLGGGVLAVGGIWGAPLRWRAQSVPAGAKFVLLPGGVVGLISGGLAVERWWLARRTDYQTGEGLVIGHWTKEVRERRTPSSSYQPPGGKASGSTGCLLCTPWDRFRITPRIPGRGRFHSRTG